jgi:hypothetical protein
VGATVTVHAVEGLPSSDCRVSPLALVAALEALAIVFASVGLLHRSPFFLFVALLVKHDSWGLVFFPPGSIGQGRANLFGSTSSGR